MTATLPAPTTVFVAEYKLILRTVTTKARLAVVGALALLSFLTAIAVSANDTFDPLGSGVGFSGQYLYRLIPVAVLVFGSATIGDLIDDGSLIYIWLRPVNPIIHVLAAIAATLTVAVPIVLVPLIASTAVISTDSGLMAGTILGGVIATITYTSLFVMLGIRFRRSLPWGLAYILIWEGFIALAGGTAAKLSVRAYVLSILSDQSGRSIRLANLTFGSAIIVPLLISAAATLYASRRLANSDVP